ncbi:MAG: hypothetical protein H6828_06905 [Planctomycetes bacterium]|nr:hypothetical protein [Planctomycetota bacterium]
MFFSATRGAFAAALATSCLLGAHAFAGGAVQLPPATPQAGVPLGAFGAERPQWSSMPLPGDFQGVGTVSTLGTSFVMQTPSTVWLWSAVTGEFTALPASPSAFVTQFNAFVLIEDGNTVHGYSTRTGQVDSLTLGAPPTLHHASTSSCWMAVAELGTDVWVFGAFDGQWRHQALAAPAPSVSVTQTAAVVDDGTTMYGVSTYFGDWVPTPSMPGATLDLQGDLAVAYTSTEVRGFSAHTSTWSTQALANGVNLTTQRGYAMFQDGDDLVAYSPCTASFTTLNAPAGATFDAGRYVGAASLGSEVWGYSSGRNTFAHRTCASAPLIELDDEVLLVQDSAGTVGFSVVTGAFSALVPGALPTTHTDCMLFLEDANEAWAYSPMQGTWSAAPIAGAGTISHVFRDVAVLQDATGCYAFSGRTGAWVYQAMGAGVQIGGSSSSDLFVAFDGALTHVFDPVLGRWATTAGGNQAANFDVWRLTFVGYVGGTAYGYSLFDNEWSPMQTQGALQALDANSSCGFVQTDTHVYAYSALGSLSTLARFPEFSRLQPLGAPLRLVQAAPPGSTVRAFFATEGDVLPWGPFGTLYVDPTKIRRELGLGTVPASGVLDVSLHLPDAASLHGLQLHVQCLVTPPGGAPYLTNAIVPVLL